MALPERARGISFKLGTRPMAWSRRRRPRPAAHCPPFHPFANVFLMSRHEPSRSVVAAVEDVKRVNLKRGARLAHSTQVSYRAEVTASTARGGTTIQF